MAQYETPKSPLVTIAGVLTIVNGVLLILAGILLLVAGGYFLSLLGMAATEAGKQGVPLDAQQQQAVGGAMGMIMGMIAIVAGCIIVLGVLPLIGGIGVVTRRGRIIAMVWAILSVLGGALGLIGDRSNSTVVIMNAVTLIYGLFATIVLAGAAKEFERPPVPQRY